MYGDLVVKMLIVAKIVKNMKINIAIVAPYLHMVDLPTILT